MYIHEVSKMNKLLQGVSTKQNSLNFLTRRICFRVVSQKKTSCTLLHSTDAVFVRKPKTTTMFFFLCSFCCWLDTFSSLLPIQSGWFSRECIGVNVSRVWFFLLKMVFFYESCEIAIKNLHTQFISCSVQCTFAKNDRIFFCTFIYI